ncbi:MAG: urease accessory protein UreE [Lentihominibacter sp.]
MIIEKVIGKIEDFDVEDLSIDRVMLDHYDMDKPHQKLRSESGETVAVSLPHGEKLFGGAVLYKDDNKMIAVDLVEEDAIEIRPSGNLQWAKAAYNIGNMHQQAYLNDDCIVVPYDAVLENMLKGIGVEYIRCRRKLTGEKANHVVGSHGHSHGHPHHHTHEYE